jgi:hypothetical protein
VGFARHSPDRDEWLMREARKLGMVTAIEEFVVDRLDLIAAILEIDGMRVEGVPISDAPATGVDSS